MNNEMAKIHVYQQLNLRNKKNRDRIMDTESILMVARGRVCRAVNEEVRG